MSTPVVVRLEHVPDRPDEFGGKTVNLARLLRDGFAVPPGFAIGAGALDAFTDRQAPALLRLRSKGPPRDLARARDLAAAVQTDLERAELPGPLADEIAAAYAELCCEDASASVAVRSSAPEEDGYQFSFAGQHATRLHVRGRTALLEQVKHGWASAHAAPALLYRARAGLVTIPRMALLVQRMVDCDAAGVLFTRDPVDPEDGWMRLEAVGGTADRLVDGHGADAAWRLSRDGDRRVPAGRAPQQDLLGCEMLSQLRDLGLALEASLPGPLDVEWAWGNGELWVLQARPVTGLSSVASA